MEECELPALRRGAHPAELEVPVAFEGGDWNEMPQKKPDRDEQRDLRLGSTPG